MKQPNLIFIVSDQHRGDWMGCAGNRIVHTPNMDRMAREGVHFTQAYCNSPLCVPSRMSMMTGQYPHCNGVFTNSDALHSDLPTMAHAMGVGGYETILCGRMHFVGPDQRHGYQQRLVGDITHCYLGGPKTSYGKLQGASGQGLKSIHTAGPGDSPVLEYDEQVVSACEQFLSDRVNIGSNSSTSNPLFMTVGLYGPHHPYVCPQSYYDRAREAMESLDTTLPRDEEPLHPWYVDWFERLQAEQISNEQLKVGRACYAGLISLTDIYVGRIIEAAQQLHGDTWIIYVSDHGDMAGDRGMFWKRNMLEGAIRVPMLWYPLKQGEQSRALSTGRQIEAPVSLIDLAPTFTSIADAPKLVRQDGDDLSPLLFDNEAPVLDKWRKRPVFVELANPQDGIIRCILQSGMKIIYFVGHNVHLLFDLQRDPQETTNLWGTPGYEKVQHELMQLITSDDWDSWQIEKQLALNKANQDYLTHWGRQVGMGPSDLWNQEVHNQTIRSDCE